MNRKSAFFLATIFLTFVMSLTSFTGAGQNRATDTTSATYRIVKAVERGDIAVFKELSASDSTLIRVKEPGRDESLLFVAARNNQGFGTFTGNLFS